LVLLGTLISLSTALPLGIIAAVKQNSILDMLIMTFSFVFISTPTFWLGLIMLFFFSFRLGWFPAIGGEEGNFFKYMSYLVLPAVCLGIREAGQLSRMIRSTMVDTLSREYITVARSKGLNEHVIRYKHALRNALSPIVSFLGVTLAIALGGVVILEAVYSRPGLGRLYIDAVSARDYPLIQGCFLVIAIVVVLINMLVDISYGIIDPRIRLK
jgi:peptide/nickel transport system permease protein